MKTWARRIDTAKKKHRPSLKNWSRDGFFNLRKEAFAALQDEPLPVRDVDAELLLTLLTAQKRKQHLDICSRYSNEDEVNEYLKQKVVDRVSCKLMSPQDFIDAFEAPGFPCIISGIPEQEQWLAVHRWTFKSLRRLKNRYFKVGEDDKGYKVTVRMKYFLQYLKENKDDSPLYIFDSKYDTDAESKVLLTEYQVPRYFPHDLFELVGDRRRPPHRWFLVGPERSGTCVHIDPLGTSAWNTLLCGRKRWVVFPPGVPKSVVKGLDVIVKGEDDEAINYFIDLVPRIKAKHPEISVMEFVQQPGDTVFIPGGWWHAVINLDNTIAITQNYCSPANFHRVWRKTRTGRKKMAVKWLSQLNDHFPQLASIACALNEEDGFVIDGNSSKAAGVVRLIKEREETERNRRREKEGWMKCPDDDDVVEDRHEDEVRRKDGSEGDRHWDTDKGFDSNAKKRKKKNGHSDHKRRKE